MDILIVLYFEIGRKFKSAHFAANTWGQCYKTFYNRK